MKLRGSAGPHFREFNVQAAVADVASIYTAARKSVCFNDLSWWALEGSTAGGVYEVFVRLYT